VIEFLKSVGFWSGVGFAVGAVAGVAWAIYGVADMSALYGFGARKKRLIDPVLDKPDPNAYRDWTGQRP